ncbi:MAG: TraR/DksA family transcriptional regulator [Solirubrobacterales bacterium]
MGAPSLSAADLEHFRAKLLEERARVLSEIDNTESEIAELQSQTTEERQDEKVGGGASFTLDREIDRALDANAEHILQEVDAALKRIDDGTYGVCTNCGKAIQRERLEALPYASTCIEHA